MTQRPGEEGQGSSCARRGKGEDPRTAGADLFCSTYEQTKQRNPTKPMKNNEISGQDGHPPADGLERGGATLQPPGGVAGGSNGRYLADRKKSSFWIRGTWQRTFVPRAGVVEHSAPEEATSGCGIAVCRATGTGGVPKDVDRSGRLGFGPVSGRKTARGTVPDEAPSPKSTFTERQAGRPVLRARPPCGMEGVRRRGAPPRDRRLT